MSYLNQSAIAANAYMFERVAQCSTQEGQADADTWTNQNRRVWASAPGWDAAWAYALATHPPTDPPTVPAYDPGADETVITDPMILAQVQSMLAKGPA